MGSTFKLQSGGSAKMQARSAGIFLICLSVVMYFVVWSTAGYVMFALGVILTLASLAASE